MEIASVLVDSDALAPLEAAHEAAWTVVDPDLLAACRDRMAMLLDHPAAPTGERATTLAAWAIAGTFDTATTACLAFTEHYLIDVASVPDDLVEPVRAELGDQGVVDFVNALLTVEQRLRLELIWERLL